MICAHRSLFTPHRLHRIPILARRRLLGALAMGLTLGGLANAAQAAGDAGVPAGLTATDWSGIREAYEANRHAVFGVEGGWQARNPGQRWRTQFDGCGFLTTPDSGGWSWGLELVSYGVARDEEMAPSRGVAPVSNRCPNVTPIINTCGQRLEYQWDEHLTEWYVNDGRGLEHGYTVHRRPEAHRLETGAKAPLQLTLAVRGDLKPRVWVDGRGVAFVNDSGAAVVNYGGLTVFDASGMMLPARFEAMCTPRGGAGVPACLIGHEEPPNQAAFHIVVDDSDAVYPLTIDPLAQQAYLKASNTQSGDFFGRSVAVSGNTVVVGADGESSSATGVNGNQADNSAARSGAAYVYARIGTTWSQQAYLKASNPDVGDRFGRSVAVSGDTIVVGAYAEDSGATGVNGDQADNSADTAGAAYVFVRDANGDWGQQAYLKASNTSELAWFGESVAVSANTVVVGAFIESQQSGAAYVFRRSGTTWSQEALLKGSNTEAGDHFGSSVAVSGGYLIVGAASEDSIATGVNGNQADNSAVHAGAAYVFVRSGSTWSQQAYLKASNTEAGDQFGCAVAMGGNTLVVGALGEASSAVGVNGNQTNNNANESGAAYVFTRSGTTWSQQAYLKASNTGIVHNFGTSVAASGDTVVVGAPGERSRATGVNGNQDDNSICCSGAAYVFTRSGTTWSQHAYLKASNTGESDFFGLSVAVSGETVVVGAYGEDSRATGVNGDQADNSAGNAGAAYVFAGDVDSDGDGVFDCDDGCPNDPNKTSPGVCGCGVPDIDGDGDGVFDCNDGCPSDPLKTLPGVCGCGVADIDRDGDGVIDCNDGCPSDSNKTTPGVCGCGVPETDTDGDTIADCVDNCPDVANADQADDNADGIGDACTTPPARQPAPGACGLCGVGVAMTVPFSLLGVLALRGRARRPSGRLRTAANAAATSPSA